MSEAFYEFIQENFSPLDETRQPELRIFCPFCHGGEHKEFSFDINIEKGTCRCWRAKCSWRGSFAKFLVDFLNIQYPEAYAILKGKPPQDADELLVLIKRAQQSITDMPLGAPQTNTETFEIWVDGSVRVQDSKRFTDVSEWLQNVRKYDPQKFFLQHDLFIPPDKSKYAGRVLFRVTTDENLAYIAYAIDKGMKPKTLNPAGAVLSRMLYNYNHAKNKRIIFICEGVFDAARLKSWGWAAVSLFGVALSVEQTVLLSRIEAEEIVVCLDNRAEEHAISIARSLASAIPDKRVSVMFLLGDGEDPDEISEDTFCEYFMNRRTYIREDINTLDRMIDSMMKKSWP